jgi:hypothetical protein
VPVVVDSTLERDAIVPDLFRAVQQSSCEAKPDYYESWVCQAVIYRRLGRHDAAAAKKRSAAFSRLAL